MEGILTHLYTFQVWCHTWCPTLRIAVHTRPQHLASRHAPRTRDARPRCAMHCASGNASISIYTAPSLQMPERALIANSAHHDPRDLITRSPAASSTTLRARQLQMKIEYTRTREFRAMSCSTAKERGGAEWGRWRAEVKASARTSGAPGNGRRAWPHGQHALPPSPSVEESHAHERVAPLSGHRAVVHNSLESRSSQRPP